MFDLNIQIKSNAADIHKRADITESPRNPGGKERYNELLKEVEGKYMRVKDVHKGGFVVRTPKSRKLIVVHTEYIDGVYVNSEEVIIP
jgi:hypothetical protein